MTVSNLAIGRIKALIFDLDGTLYQNDTIGTQVNSSARRYVAQLKGVDEGEAEAILERERALQKQKGGTLSHSIMAMGGDLRSMHAALAAGVHPEGVLSVDPRVTRLLKKLSARFRLYLYTNNNRKLSGRIMKEIGVTGFFDKVFTVEDFWRPKPDAEIIKVILREIGCVPDETLFVGDRYEVDLRVPESLGCQVMETQTIEELLELHRVLPPAAEEEE